MKASVQSWWRGRGEHGSAGLLLECTEKISRAVAAAARTILGQERGGQEQVHKRWIGCG